VFKKKSLAADKPAILQQHPVLEQFIHNLIETNYGIQLPAIVHGIVETFSRDGIDQNIFSDKDLLQYINELLINKFPIGQHQEMQLGKGVGLQTPYIGDGDPNQDPFTLLSPNGSR
jgi:hypothetical protein